MVLDVPGAGYFAKVVILATQKISLVTVYVEGWLSESCMRVDTQEFIWYQRRTNALLETLGIRTSVPASFIRLKR